MTVRGKPFTQERGVEGILYGLLALATASFTSGCSTDPQSVETGLFPAGERMAYVVNGLSETLSGIDLANGNVYNDVLELGKWPNDISGEAGGGILYVVNSGDNQVMEIDRETGRVTRRIDVGVGQNPWECESDGTRLWVTNFLTGEVAVIDLGAWIVSERIEVGTTLEAVASDEDGVYVTDTAYRYGSFGRGKVIKLNRSTGTEVGATYVGTNPQDLLLDQTGRLHVLCTGSYTQNGEAEEGEVHIIDQVSMVPLDTVSLGGNPSSMCEAAEGIIYVAGYWGGVMAYEAASLEIINDSVSPLLGGDGYTDIESDPSSGTLYICEFDADRVIVLDRSTGTVMRRIGVGDGPVRILISEEEASPGEPVSHFRENASLPNSEKSQRARRQR